MKLVQYLKTKTNLFWFSLCVIQILIYTIISVVLVQQKTFWLLPFDVLLIAGYVYMANVFWQESKSWQ